MDETGIRVKVGCISVVGEFIKDPVHAVELFFETTFVSGDIRVGSDPEMNDSKQIIRDVKFLSIDEIIGLSANERHGIFMLVSTSAELKKLSGYYRI
jgi:hypothetical protein